MRYRISLLILLITQPLLAGEIKDAFREICPIFVELREAEDSLPRDVHETVDALWHTCSYDDPDTLPEAQQAHKKIDALLSELKMYDSEGSLDEQIIQLIPRLDHGLETLAKYVGKVVPSETAIGPTVLPNVDMNLVLRRLMALPTYGGSRFSDHLTGLEQAEKDYQTELFKFPIVWSESPDVLVDLVRGKNEDNSRARRHYWRSIAPKVRDKESASTEGKALIPVVSKFMAEILPADLSERERNLRAEILRKTRNLLSELLCFTPSLLTTSTSTLPTPPVPVFSFSTADAGEGPPTFSSASSSSSADVDKKKERIKRKKKAQKAKKKTATSPKIEADDAPKKGEEKKESKEPVVLKPLSAPGGGGRVSPVSLAKKEYFPKPHSLTRRTDRLAIWEHYFNGDDIEFFNDLFGPEDLHGKYKDSGIIAKIKRLSKLMLARKITKAAEYEKEALGMVHPSHSPGKGVKKSGSINIAMVRDVTIRYGFFPVKWNLKKTWTSGIHRGTDEAARQIYLKWLESDYAPEEE